MRNVEITGTLAADLETVRSVARGLGIGVWLVGGPVRDALLGRGVSDLDFLVEERVDELAEAVSGRLEGSVRNYPEFMTAKVLHPNGRTIDFTTARQELYPRPGALPVVYEAPVQTDLLRRDFTINAIAWNLGTATLLDPTGGLADLERRVIRILHDGSFLDDPTRIFRAMRFASRLGFDLEPGTARRLRDALTSGALTTVSPERLWRELVLCLREPDPGSVVSLLLTHGILQTWFGTESVDPALPARISLLVELCREWDEVDEEVLCLAVLLVGMEGATMPGGTGFSRRRMESLDRLVRLANEGFEQWSSLETDEDRARFCLKLSPEEAIVLALFVDRPRELATMCRELRAFRLPFDGSDLGVPPGPHVGRALREARIRAWLETMPAAESLEFARRTALRYLKTGQ